MGGSFGGRYYAVGLAFFAVALLMLLRLEWSPVAYGLVWAVCLDVDGELALPDNCFYLLPGMPYTIPWTDALGAPTIAAIGPPPLTTLA